MSTSPAPASAAPPTATPPATALPTSARRGLATDLVVAGEHFTDAELQALVHRGAIDRVLPGVYCRSRAARDAETRAAALWLLAGPVLAAGWTAVGPSAAWVLAGGPAPPRIHAAVAHYHRLPAGGTVLPWALVQSDVAAGPQGHAEAEADVMRIGPARVTTPARTVEDLLLTGDPDHARRAAHVMARHGTAGLTERLARPTRRAGVVAARARLAALLTALEAPG